MNGFKIKLYLKRILLIPAYLTILTRHKMFFMICELSNEIQIKVIRIVKRVQYYAAKYKYY